MSHLWQRFLLASALVFGLFIGVVATVFGYSNTGTVDVRWSIFHIDGVPLWTVALVPLTIVLAAGTLYHWFNGLHHFTEHMRHRRRVHELEAEVATLRDHLDHVLEMPDQSSSRLPGKHVTAEASPEPIPAVSEPSAPITAPPALPEAAPHHDGEGNGKSHHRAARRRAALTVAAEHRPADGAVAGKNAEAAAEVVTVPATSAAEP